MRGSEGRGKVEGRGREREVDTYVYYTYCG